MLSTATISTLLRLPGVGRRTVLKMIDLPTSDTLTIDDIQELLRASGVKRLRSRMPSQGEIRIALEEALRGIEQAESTGIEILGYSDSTFPERLRSIPDPPVLLYVKGDPSLLDETDIVGVVGTREPTEHGAELAYHYGEILAESNQIVLSGLARGCDSQAHRGCLFAGGKSVAVLAHGLDIIRPKEHVELSEDILVTHGSLVSEYPAGEPARKRNYVDRDRLQSGLSKGIIIVETDLKGGTMHTASFAHKQNRPIACSTHYPLESDRPQIQGNWKLVSDKQAYAIQSDSDITSFLEMIATQAFTPLETPSKGELEGSSQLQFPFGDEPKDSM